MEQVVSGGLSARWVNNVPVKPMFGVRLVKRPKVTFREPGISLFEEKIDEVHKAVAEAVEYDARRLAPKKTGALAASIRARKSSTRRYRVYVGTDHWRFMEYGVRPHQITPRRKRALYWDGAPHPMSVVNHPGTLGQPFMRPALYHKRTMFRLPGGRVRVSRGSSLIGLFF
jgi:hypothetical protein